MNDDVVMGKVQLAQDVPRAIEVASPTPLSMLDKAVASGAQIDVMERLMALYERWQADQARRAFTAALSAMRAEMPQIVKDRQVDFTTARGRTHYRYEDLAAMTETLSPVMARHGLSFRWRTDSTQKGFVSVTCILEHRDGHAEETTLSGPYDDSGNKNAIQSIGSVTTYLQRYTLKAAIGIAAAQDDDGQQGGPSKPERAPSKPPLGRRHAPKSDPNHISEAQARRIIAIARTRGEEFGVHGFEVCQGVLRDCGLQAFPSNKRDDALLHLVESVEPAEYDEFCHRIEAWEPPEASDAG